MDVLDLVKANPLTSFELKHDDYGTKLTLRRKVGDQILMKSVISMYEEHIIPTLEAMLKDLEYFQIEHCSKDKKEPTQ